MNPELQKICINPEMPLKQAVSVLNEGHKRIVFVIENGILVGILTDSDVRRAILKGVSFDLPVKNVMIQRPLVATAKMDNKQILSMMKSSTIYQIPIVNEEGVLLDLKLIEDLLDDNSGIEAFIFAGGLGTRLQPITEKIPKPLIEIGGKVMLFTIIDSLLAAGIRKITLALNYKSEMIKEAVKQKGIYEKFVSYLVEPERLGTAGALSLYKPESEVGPFLVMNADVLSTVDYNSMINFHNSEKHSMSVAVRQESVKIPFGVTRLQGTKVLRVDEKPEVPFFVSAGIYLINHEILKLIPKETYFDMPDLINRCIDENYNVGSFPVHEYWIDIGRHSELERAQEEMKTHFLDSKNSERN